MSKFIRAENGAKEILAEALRLTQNKQGITQLLNSIARTIVN